jgi:DNA-directed RNA polymerase subunit RPC12/RpoP
MITGGLMGSPTKSGTMIFICSQCGAEAQPGFGDQNKSELAHILRCPKCRGILWQWKSMNEQEEELRAFAEKVMAARAQPS